MAIGDAAQAAGLAVFPATEDLRKGYENDNTRGDEIAALIYKTAIVGKVLVPGTSIVDGVGVSSPAKAYPARLEHHLTEQVYGMPVTVIAAGVPGDTSADMRARLPALLAEHRPAFVPMEIPINDAALTKALTAQETLDNMLAMAAMCRLAGSIPIFLTHQQINPAQANAPTLHTDATQRLATANRRNVMAKAAERGIAVVDIFAIMQHLTNVLWDGIHPNDFAANLWGLSVARTIVQLGTGGHTETTFADEFDRTSTTTAGPGWAPLAGAVAGTDGQSAYFVTGYDGAIVVHSAGGTDIDFTARMGRGSGALSGGILIRSDGTGRGYLATYDTIGSVLQLALYALSTSDAVELGRTTVTDFGNDIPLTINASGGALLVSHNGEPQLSAYSTVFPDGSYIGLRRSANAAVRWGNAVVVRSLS